MNKKPQYPIVIICCIINCVLFWQNPLYAIHFLLSLIAVRFLWLPDLFCHVTKEVVQKDHKHNIVGLFEDCQFSKQCRCVDINRGFNEDLLALDYIREINKGDLYEAIKLQEAFFTMYKICIDDYIKKHILPNLK